MLNGKSMIALLLLLVAVVTGGCASGDAEKPLESEDAELPVKSEAGDKPLESEVAEKPLDEVSLRLGWIAGPQFAGFYAAEQQGFYAEEGLDVTQLMMAGQTVDIGADVTRGTTDFGIHTGTGIVSDRAKGDPITAIAALHRVLPLAFLTLKGSGIKGPEDFPGHSIGTMFADVGLTFNALMSRLGLDPDSVTELYAISGMLPFLSGEIDIIPGFVTHEVLDARRQGSEVNVFTPRDYGIHLYGDTLFTSERLIKEKPDVVLRFLRATLRGYRWSVENPEEAGRLALAYASERYKGQSIEHMRASIPLIHTGEDQIGWMRREVWQGTHDILLEQGVISGPVDIDKVYTMEFLQQIYGDQGN